MKKKLLFIIINVIISGSLVLVTMVIFKYGLFEKANDNQGIVSASVAEITNNQINTPVPSTPIPRRTETVNLLEINFDNEDDLMYIEDNSKNKYKIQDGCLIFNNDTSFDDPVIIHRELDMDTLIHYRIKTSHDAATIHIQVGDDDGNFMYINENERYIYAGRMEDEGIAHYEVGYEGFPYVNHNDKWVDLIIYKEAEGYNYRIIINNSDSTNNIAYGSIAFYKPDMYQGMWYVLCHPRFDETIDSQIQIDFIKYATGPIDKYLEKYIPAYLANKERVDEFLQNPCISYDEYVYQVYGESYYNEEEMQRNDEEDE